MNRKSGTSKDASDKLVRGIKRKTRKHYSAEEKIKIVLAGLRDEDNTAALCRRDSIGQGLTFPAHLEPAVDKGISVHVFTNQAARDIGLFKHDTLAIIGKFKLMAHITVLAPA